MGAGFAIAMRDLEIRGAGNILGTEQSGHIATVGYELYCDLLEQAVRRLKQLPPKTSIEVDVDLPGEGYIPRAYVPDMRLKIDLYRRLAPGVEPRGAGRFPGGTGRPLRAAPPAGAASAGAGRDSHRRPSLADHARSIWRTSTPCFTYSSARQIQQLAAASGGRLRVVDAKSAYLPLDKEVARPESVLADVKSLLQRE